MQKKARPRFFSVVLLLMIIVYNWVIGFAIRMNQAPRAEMSISELNGDYVIIVHSITDNVELNKSYWEVCDANGKVDVYGRIYDFERGTATQLTTGRTMLQMLI